MNAEAAPRGAPGEAGDVDVVVVGAGLAGLTAAAVAARAGQRVVLLERATPGGRARTDERSGFLLNQGPRALYLAGAGSRVLKELGIATRGEPPSRKVAAWRDGRLALLPTSAGSLLRSPVVGMRGKLHLARLLAGLRKLDVASLAPLNASGWVDSLGLSPDARAVVSTLLRVASYAHDLDAISADGAVGQLQLVQAGNVRYLHGGWAQLVNALAATARAAGARMVSGDGVQALVARSQGWEVRMKERTWSTTSVVVAVGAPAAARALLPVDPGWALGPGTTAACLDLGLRGPPRWRVAFGLDEPLYLSTHCPSAELAPGGGAVVHVMRYGATSGEEDRRALWRLARAAGVADDEIVVQRFLHRMVVSHSLPAPGRGLAGRPPVAVPGQRGLFVAGDWVGPNGMLADASISSGAEAGRAASGSERAAGSDAPARLAG